jgi:hypothetical protein
VWLSALLDPAGLIARNFDGFGVLSALAVSGLAFTTISLQAALDLSRTSAWSSSALTFLVLRGALLGTLGVAALALLAWVLSRPFATNQGVSWTVRAFGAAYGNALSYGLFGLALNLFLGWNTAVSCGVTGLLWALGPLFVAVRELAGGRSGVAAVLSSICGGLLLFGWVQFGVGP